jgi:Domain of Unknown Function with PDB structure (DUF3857)/Transglutaminase-like superfamily
MSVKLRICLTGIFLFLQIYLSAQEKAETYIKAPIPDSLTRGADAVCRLYEKHLEIKSPGHANVAERFIYTILNENGIEYSNVRVFYDKFTSINSIDIYVYDAAGKELKHFKKKDFDDRPVDDGSSFVNDIRCKTGTFTANVYPYSIVVEKDVTQDGILFPFNWNPPRSEKLSLQFARYTIAAPGDYRIRYKMINSDISPVIAEKDNKKTYSWEIHNFPIIPDEVYAISYKEFAPYLYVSPSDFEAEGYTGNMSSWNEYAKFFSDLRRGRDIIPDDLKLKVHQLTDGIRDTTQKVYILYDYLQRNSHYVGIQLGIGGFQPFEASYVAKNKYGDCKALSNFMVALLKEAGVKSNQVLIRAGEGDTEFESAFTTYQFNHMICCVPMAKDTIWLECTDQFLPPGYLSGFTANRYGLLIEENGGALVHTPNYTIDDNTQIRKISAQLNAEGDLNFKSRTRYRALSMDGIEKFIHHHSKEEQLNRLKTKYDLSTYNVNSFDYAEDYSGKLPEIRESLDITVTSYAQVSGRRIFVSPNILSKSSAKLPDEKDRKLDIEFKEEFRRIDSVEIMIPPGYETESGVKNISLTTKFGKYQTNTVIRDNKIIYFRQLDKYSGRFPATDYEAMQKFYNDIYDADHIKIVFIKKD